MIVHSEISKIRSEGQEIDAQKAFVLKKVLEAGSHKIQDVLESMLRCGVDSRVMSTEISDSDEVTRKMASASHHHILVSSDLGGDMKGKALLAMSGRDFTAICELLRKVNPHSMHPEVSAEMMENLVPEWVRTRASAHSSSFEVREMMFDAVAEFANMVFSGYLMAAHKFLGLTTFHSPPVADVGLRELELDYRLRPNARNRHYTLCAENQFVAPPYEFKVWFLLIPGEQTFAEILNRIEVVDLT